MNKKLKSFIEQSYAKVKKAKKSPKNFIVWSENGIYAYAIESKFPINQNTVECGNLALLYDNRNITPKIVEKINKFIPFNNDWIPFIKLAFSTIFSNEKWVYNDMDSDFQQLISKKEFNNLVNYSLNK